MQSNDLTLYNEWRQRRNASAFNELARRHAGMVYSTCRRILRCSEAAEDVAQECFETLATTGQGPERNLGAWLHALATRRALNRLKSEQRRQERERAYAAKHVDAVEVQWDDLYDLVDEGIAVLPEKLREPLIRNYFEGQSHAAIAAELGISRTTVTYRVNKGVGLVRRYLKRNGVVVGTAALAALLQANLAAAAAPEVLTDHIARIALAGPSGGAAAPAVVALAAQGAKTKLLAGLSAAIVLLVMGTTAVLFQRHEPGGVPLPPLPADFGAATNPLESAVEFESSDPDPAIAQGAKSRPPTFTTSIVGRLVDSSGTPVTGAEVVLERQFEPFLLADWGGSDPLPPYRAVQTTDEAGSFAFEAAPFAIDAGRYNGYHTFRLTSNADARGASHLLRAGVLGPRNYVEMTLEHYWVVRGRVLDANGTPVSDPTFKVWRRIGNATRFQDIAVLDPPVAFDEDGRFRIEVLPAEGYTLRVSGEGHAAARREVFAGQDDVTITLPPPLRVSGTVLDRDSGRPMAGVKLLAWSDPEISHEAVSDEQGQFVIEPLAPEHHYLRPAMGNQPLAMEPLGERLDLRPGVSVDNLQLTVYQGGAITGTVRDGKTGEALVGVAVQASMPDQPNYAGGTLGWRVRTDETGRYRVEGLPRGEFIFIAETAGARPSKAMNVHPGRLYEGVDLQVYPGVRIIGTVLDERGEPVAGAWVASAGDDGPLSLMVVSDDAGKFVLPTYREPGWHEIVRLQAMTATGVSRPTEPVPLDSPTLDNIVLRLQSGIELEGTVRYASGRPASGASVVVTANTPDSDVLGFLDHRPPTKGVQPGAAATSTSATGKFRIGPLPRGAYTVAAYPPDGSAFAASTICELGSGDNAVQLVFSRALEERPALVGTVTLAGDPVAGAQVSLTPETPDPKSQFGRTDTDGRYRIDGVVPGPAKLFVSYQAAGPTGGDSRQIGPISLDIHESGETVEDVALGGGSATVTGTVHRTGRPVSRIMVSVRQPSGETVHTTTDTDGRFELTHVEDGAIEIFAVKAKLNAADDVWNQNIEATVAPGERLVIDFTMGSGEIAGTVSGASAEDSAMVCLVTETFDAPPTFEEAMRLGGGKATVGCALCEPDGAYRIQNVPAGEYTLLAVSARENAPGDGIDPGSYRVGMSPVEIAEGMVTEADLVLQGVPEADE